MSAGYQAVTWDASKKTYDRWLLTGVVLYLAAFAGATAVLRPTATIETILLRGLATAAFLLLHVILSIGPLARLDRRFLPLLYNRRHMGVTMFLLAAAHAGLAIFQFHGLGDLNPFVSLLSAERDWTDPGNFPFQPLGLAALTILFLMAATSHDFWLANLTPPVWKSIHMGVYAAYALVVCHVALGALQAETSPVLAGAVGLGLVWVVGIHAAAGLRERAGDRPAAGARDDGGFVDVCAAAEIPEKRAVVACLGGERVAVYRYDGKVSALSNVCQHQNGPLGEGKIVDGCVTCPWHGFTYRPEDGAAPPPFTEKVPTFHVRVENGRVLVHPAPLPPGTRVEPAVIE